MFLLVLWLLTLMWPHRRCANSCFKRADADCSYSTTRRDLERHFSKYGDIDKVDLITDNQGRSRGFGFINFLSVEVKPSTFLPAFLWTKVRSCQSRQLWAQPNYDGINLFSIIIFWCRTQWLSGRNWGWMRLHHLVGGCTGPRYSLSHFYEQDKN